MGFAFDNKRNIVTAWIDGKADDYWIDNPQQHPFFKWPAEGGRQAQLHRMPGLQDGENPQYPPDQFYTPPEQKPLSRELISRDNGVRTELHRYAFTKVRVTLRENREVISRELVSLRANPFWFAHDLYTPPSAADGGPFTIRRVIHSSRSVGFTGFIGGVAVFGAFFVAAGKALLIGIVEWHGHDDARSEQSVAVHTTNAFIPANENRIPSRI